MRFLKCRKIAILAVMSSVSVRYKTKARSPPNQSGKLRIDELKKSKVLSLHGVE